MSCRYTRGQLVSPMKIQQSFMKRNALNQLQPRLLWRRQRPRSMRSSSLATAIAVMMVFVCRGWSSPEQNHNLLPSFSRPLRVRGGCAVEMILRVRMPDGVVKRVRASPGDSVLNLMSKLDIASTDSMVGLSPDPTGEAAEPATSIAALGLKNGDFLYVKNDAAAGERAQTRQSAVKRMKLAAGATSGRGSQHDKFVPFPDQARPPPPRSNKRVKTWQDLEAIQAQTFSLKPQKESNVKKISVEQSAMDEFVGHLKERGLGHHRCALLLGRTSPTTKGIKVEAMYEPQQDASSSSSGGGKTYDSTALTEAASRALSAKAQGGDGVESGDSSQAQAGGAIEDVARAVRVAELLGLRLVGWCLSHDKREHFMAARDVVTAAAMQLWAMSEKGKEDGVLVATVTIPVNVTDGEVTTEAFTVSNQTVQMFSEGIFADIQDDPTSDRVATNAVVKESGKETRAPETLGLICNVGIVQHEGVLQTRFPVANRGRRSTLSDLKACLFDPVPAPRTVSKDRKSHKQPSFLKRLSDFQLLIFLSRQMGFSRDFEELCTIVRKRDAKSPSLEKLKVVLANLCESDTS